MQLATGSCSTLRRLEKLRACAYAPWFLCGLVLDTHRTHAHLAHLEYIATPSINLHPKGNQIEAHPYLQQTLLLDWCTDHGITVTAYAPLAPLTKIKGGPVSAVVKSVAAAHGKTEGQVLLRWQVQSGRLPLTTTSKPERYEHISFIFSNDDFFLGFFLFFF